MSKVSVRLCHVTSDGAMNQLCNKIRKLAQILRLRAEIPEMAAAVATTARNVLLPEPEINLRNPASQHFVAISDSCVIPWQNKFSLGEGYFVRQFFASDIGGFAVEVKMAKVNLLPIRF